jgi:Fe-S cluster biogenesis protein NfuA
MNSELKDRVQLVINRIRPQLQADGGRRCSKS